MKFYQIKITARDKKSLKKFLFLFSNLLNKLNLNIKYYKKEKRKKVLTILKSPHVNKKAQEQFQVDTFFTDLNIFVPNNFKILMILKKLKNNIFSNISLKIMFVTNYNLINKINRQKLNPNNFNLKLFHLNKNFKKINIFLNILDIYGEISLAT